MDALLKFILPAVLMVLTLIFGFWVSRMGKPYNGFLFNIHKLLALGTVVVLVIQLVPMLRSAPASPQAIAVMVVAVICTLALFAGGALMSAGKSDYALMLAVHKIAPAVLVVSLALTVYELVK